MVDNPLESLADYSRFLATLLNRTAVIRSNIIVWSTSPFTGVAEGEVLFIKGFRLRTREEIDFDERRITSYGVDRRDNGR